MALQTSGAISINDLRTEFGYLGATTGLGSSLLYRDSTDPYIGTIPASGQISMDDFYGASIRTARLNARLGVAYNNFSFGIYNTRIGWSRLDGSQFYLFESGSQNNAMGSITRDTSLSTRARLGGIWCTNYYLGSYAGSSFYRYAFNISHRSSSNSGWTTVQVKGPNGSNGSTVVYTVNRSSMQFKRQYGNTEQRNHYQWTLISSTSTVSNGYSQGSTAGLLASMFTYARINNRPIYVRFS